MYTVLNGVAQVETFATPDSAYEFMKTATRMGGKYALTTLVLKSGHGLGSTTRAFARCGVLYDPMPCRDCNGTGKDAANWGGCYYCTASCGYIAGTKVPS